MCPSDLSQWHGVCNNEPSECIRAGLVPLYPAISQTLGEILKLLQAPAPSEADGQRAEMLNAVKEALSRLLQPPAKSGAPAQLHAETGADASAAAHHGADNSQK